MPLQKLFKNFLDSTNRKLKTFSGHSLPSFKRRSLPSFTLIELLVVISIIGVLAGMVLFMLAGAQQDASIARTQATIQKLNNIILARWEEFRYRPVKVNLPSEALEPFVVAGQRQTRLSPREGARLRMMILRDTMRMEFPDRYSDILYPPTIYNAVFFTADNAKPLSDTSNDRDLYTIMGSHMSREVPGQYNNLRRRFVTTGALANPTTVDPTLPQGALLSNITLEYQGAELLYQIVSTTNFEGSNGLEYFRPTEIGDVDGDNMPEFIDAWGQPIRWIRWPAGYGIVDPSGSVLTSTQRQSSRPSDYVMNDWTTAEPDPLDPLRTDWRWTDWVTPPVTYAYKPWMLVPLIVSAGPDGQFDLQFDEGTAIVYSTQTWSGPTDSPRHTATPYFWVDPYRGFYNQVTGASELGGLGQWLDEDGNHDTFGAADNITNYSLLLR